MAKYKTPKAKVKKNYKGYMKTISSNWKGISSKIWGK